MKQLKTQKVPKWALSDVQGGGQEAVHVERTPIGVFYMFIGAFYMYEGGKGAKQVECAPKGTFYVFEGGEGAKQVECALKGTFYIFWEGDRYQTRKCAHVGVFLHLM